VYDVVHEATTMYLAEGQAAALDRIARAKGVSRAELIRELIDRAIGRHYATNLVADLAAIDGSFGALAGEETLALVRDQRMDYLIKAVSILPTFRPPRRLWRVRLSGSRASHTRLSSEVQESQSFAVSSGAMYTPPLSMTWLSSSS